MLTNNTMVTRLGNSTTEVIMKVLIDMKKIGIITTVEIATNMWRRIITTVKIITNI